MIKMLMMCVTGLIVIVVFTNILSAQNATAIGTTPMSVLNLVTTFIAIAMLGVIAVFAAKSYNDNKSGF